MSITAIVPVWNGRDLLERLLATLDAQTKPPAEVLVVDNGSTDGAPELARRRGARVLAMGRNAGFAPAVNRGIRESRSEWVAALNSDVELAPDYFATLLAGAAAEDAWFATGKLLAGRRPGIAPTAGAEEEAVSPVLDGAFDLVCRGGAAWRAGSGRVFGPPFSARRKIWSAPWTAALFRAELFTRVGLLEESFESHLEDVDFGLRCARSGLAGLYEPAATAWHQGSATGGRWTAGTVRRMARNQIWILARHYPGSLVRRYGPSIFAAQALWGALAVRHGAGTAWLRGEWEGWRGFSHARAGHAAWPDDALDRLLGENERAIHQIQAIGGFDWYWKMYFLLTGSEAK
ncbi:MAG: glycosyltransferase family 2 protein [Bryobacteraceae bacterium]|jgi:GT2 family glycosyltransferase